VLGAYLDQRRCPWVSLVATALAAIFWFAAAMVRLPKKVTVGFAVRTALPKFRWQEYHLAERRISRGGSGRFIMLPLSELRSAMRHTLALRLRATGSYSIRTDEGSISCRGPSFT
jgi:hypothetical protein